MKLLRRLIYKLMAAIALVLLVLLIRSDVKPERWTPAPLPALSGAYAPGDHTRFGEVELVAVPAAGPEDVTADTLGRLVTGLSDGSIVRIGSGPDRALEVLTNTGGRPLGLQYDALGNLIIADAHKGLLSMSPDGTLSVLTDSVNGTRMRFVDDLDIADDGTIWFSDASQRFGLDQFMKDILEASATGRLLSYSPKTGRTTVHLTDVYFANGVALGPDDRFVLVSETGTGRIHRLWLGTERAGEREVFIDGLPGHPDNVSFDDIGTFWIALPALRDPARERASRGWLLRKLMGGLPADRLHVDTSVGFVVGVGLDAGLQHMRYADPSDVAAITSVNRLGDKLVMGSLRARQIMIVPAPNSTPSP